MTSGSTAEAATATAETHSAEANTTTVPVLAQGHARSGRSASDGAGSGPHFAGTSQTNQIQNQHQEQDQERVRKSRLPHLRRHPILVQLAFDVHPHAHARRTSPASACAPRPPSGPAPTSSARASPSQRCSRAIAIAIVLARDSLDRGLVGRRASLHVCPPSLPPLLHYHLNPHSHCRPHLGPRDWTRTGDPQGPAGRRSSSGSRWRCWRGGGARFVPYGSYGSCGGSGSWVRTYSSLVLLLDQTHSSANATAIDVQRKTCSANSSLRTTARAGG